MGPRLRLGDDLERAAGMLAEASATLAEALAELARQRRGLAPAAPPPPALPASGRPEPEPLMAPDEIEHKFCG